MNIVSVFAKTVGGIAGKARIYPDIMQAASKTIHTAEGTIIADSFVTHAADRLVLLMVHEPDADITKLRNELFSAAQKNRRRTRTLQKFHTRFNYIHRV